MGYNISGKLDACSAGVDLDVYTESKTTARASAGGLVARIESDITVSNCYATGNIKSISRSINGASSNSYVGGLVASCNSRSNVDKCYATGNVIAKVFFNNPGISSSTAYAGGLVGDGGTIKNSFAKGNAKAYDNKAGVSDYSFAGGLFGRDYGNKVENSYRYRNQIIYRELDNSTTITSVPSNNLGEIIDSSYSDFIYNILGFDEEDLGM